jgi:peroxiredoxin Q/BCP
MCGFEASAIGLNEPVPAFEAIDDEGNAWKSTDYIGKKMVVLYFYPADMTGVDARRRRVATETEWNRSRS